MYACSVILPTNFKMFTIIQRVRTCILLHIGEAKDEETKQSDWKQKKPYWTEDKTQIYFLLLLLLFSCLVMSKSVRPHGLQHVRLSCPSPSPRACSNSCPLSLRCHPTIMSSVNPFSFCLQPFPASGSFLVSQLFTAGGQSIGASASASVLPMNIQD